MSAPLNLTTYRGSHVHVKKVGMGDVRLQISHPGMAGSCRAVLDPDQRRELAAYLLHGIEATS